MLVSIVTVCFNSERTIRDTLNSVKKQSHDLIEHIIIDGKSKDKTLNIISEYNHVSKIISESDEGIYDAMNKGLSLCNGDIVGFLNSDDFFYDDNVISGYVEKFENQDADVVYGDLDFIAENQNKTVRFQGIFLISTFLIILHHSQVREARLSKKSRKVSVRKFS